MRHFVGGHVQCGSDLADITINLVNAGFKPAHLGGAIGHLARGIKPHHRRPRPRVIAKIEQLPGQDLPVGKSIALHHQPFATGAQRFGQQVLKQA